MVLANQDDKGIVRWIADDHEVSLNVKTVIAHFQPNATAYEAFAFIRYCQAYRLDPFQGDAFLVKYGQNDPAQNIMASHSWTKRAKTDPEYAGHRVGIIVETADGIDERRDTLYWKPGADKLVGGWAEIKKTDGTTYRTELGIQSRIVYKKDGEPAPFWRRMPETMIVKCCLSDAFRNFFPLLFAGAYDGAELGDGQLGGGLVIDALPGSTVNMETGEIIPAPAETASGISASGLSLEEEEAAWAETTNKRFEEDAELDDEEAHTPSQDTSEPDGSEQSSEQILDEAVGPSASAGNDWPAPKRKGKFLE